MSSLIPEVHDVYTDLHLRALRHGTFAASPSSR